jgi:hypothetical protein
MVVGGEKIYKIKNALDKNLQFNKYFTPFYIYPTS